tara:strand:+ start:16262 stop:19672 length:3411 start_codon:yes stop_codon:yes gene_type:complete
MDSSENEMTVIKRDGKKEYVLFDKISKRVKTICNENSLKINTTGLVMKVIDQIYDGIETTKIDELTADQCASLASTHTDYSTLASFIIISNHQKNCKEKFSDVMYDLYNFKDANNINAPLVSLELINFITENEDAINEICDFKRDYLIDYFGFKTLERAYLMKINGKPVERIQHMWLRVAIGIHGNNMDKIKETYFYMSQKYFTHATPTLFNAGTPHPQLSSCFLQAMESDSINGIYNTLKDCALISKWAGGIGLHVHNVRASGSHIRGTNGTSNGLVPMLKVFNNTAKYVDQCIVPETYLYTTDGPKKIENVIAGETKIMNDKGFTEVIDNVLEHPYNGRIFEIETMHSLYPLKITEEHPVLCLSGQTKGLNYNVIKNRLDKKIISNEWKDVKDLTPDDMLVYKIPKYEKDIENISEDDCYFYGVLLGDGCLDNLNQTGYISLHTINKNYILEFCEKYLSDRCIQYKVNIQENTTRIRWNKNIAIPIRYAEVYDENKEKYIANKWLHLPLIKIKNIIKGLIDTDGSKGNELAFDNTSQKLVESLKYLLLRLGVPTSGYIRDRIGESHNTKNGLIENKKISYCLRIPKTDIIASILNIENGDFHKFFVYDDFIYSRIKSINELQYNGTLYDLQMKDVHNYLTHNGIIHNGGGRRNGSFAIYLEPWHADIELFLQMRKNHGDEELKARDLFYALWIPDLFMERVKTNGKWTLMCPDECPGLSDCYGYSFKELYVQYENQNKGKREVNARDLWFQILDAQMETGTPYLLYKDACNEKSNQKNVGVIKSSNLCTEIVEYSDENETAVCNLASIALPTFVDDNGNFDYQSLHKITRIVTENLNRVIDVNYYPTDKTRVSNMRHRPIGLGVSGLADAYLKMNIPFHSDDAKIINRDIFETIYHAALTKSCELSKEFGKYETFDGSPASQGVLQFDMWNVVPDSQRYDWEELKQNIKTFGLRNSLLLAPMPTASTSQILGVNECIEPITSNIYNRRTLAGEFILTNKYLMKDLIELDMWNEKIKNNIIANNGSVQQIELIPQNIKDKYKTVWEIPMKHLIDMAADRGAFICQSQSLNLWLEEPNYNTLTSMHFYSWNKGLKTGIYYLRRRARHQAQQFTIEPEKKDSSNNTLDDEECVMCSA